MISPIIFSDKLCEIHLTMSKYSRWKSVDTLFHLKRLSSIQLLSFQNLVQLCIASPYHKSRQFYHHFLQYLIILRPYNHPFYLCNKETESLKTVHFYSMGKLFHTCDNELQYKTLCYTKTLDQSNFSELSYLIGSF